MRKVLTSSLVAVICLILPGIASAHTGSVSCTTAGVVFHYNADFPANENVTQTVNGISNVVNVKAHLAQDFVVVPELAGGNNIVQARSVRSNNVVVANATLVCPVPPVPPVTPKPVCPEGTVQDLAASTDTYAICVKTVVNTVTTPPTYITQYVDKWHPGKVITKWKTKYKNKIRLVPWCPLPPHKKSGVTG